MTDANRLVTAESASFLIRELCTVARSARPEANIALVLDAARAHVHPSIPDIAHECKISVVYVPVRLTWLLQPLTSHVFGLLRRTLHKMHAATQLRYKKTQLDKLHWLNILIDGVRKVLVARSWVHRFLANAMPPDNPHIRQAVLHLCQGYVPDMPLPLSFEDFSFTLGRKRPEIYADLFPLAKPLMLELADATDRPCKREVA